MTDIIINFVNTYVVRFVINLVIAAVILIVGFKLVGFVCRRLSRHRLVEKLDSNIGALLVSTLRVLLNTLIIIIAIQILGVPSATIVAVIGSCGLAVGLALQGGLSNMAGGVMLMVFKPFHVGDYISTSEAEGTVEDIGVFYTRLVTIDNKSVSIPNSLLSSVTVTNLSEKDTRGIDISSSVAYGSDVEAARNALVACAEAEPLVLKEPQPTVFVTEHGESGIKLTLRVFAESKNCVKARAALQEHTVSALFDAGIEIPYPHIDVKMK